MRAQKIQVSADKTRLAVAVPSETYRRLSLHCGTKPGALWQFVTRAINAELARVYLGAGDDRD